MIKKLSKIPLPADVGRISPERFQRGSRNFTFLSGKIGLTDLPDMTPLADSGQLQNAIKYCLKVRRMGAAGNESNNSATV